MFWALRCFESRRVRPTFH